MSLFKIITKEEFEEKSKYTYGKKQIENGIEYQPYNIKDFHIVRRGIFRSDDIEFVNKNDFVRFWQAGFMGLFIFCLLPLIFTHFAVHTLTIIAACVIIGTTLTDISGRFAWPGFVLGLDMAAIGMLVYHWIINPPSVAVGISFAATFLITTYLSRTSSFQCNMADRIGWYFLYYYLPLILPQQYLIAGLWILFGYYLVSTPICNYVIGPRLKKLGFPIYVQICVAFAVITYFVNHMIK